ncbi:MAG: hypothetical protein ACFFDT_36015, partial [Candidatus Hodarchaeota archaeon]
MNYRVYIGKIASEIKVRFIKVKNSNWFTFPFFLTHRWFPIINIFQIFVGVLLYGLMALEANMVSEWLKAPTTYLNPLGGILFTFFYLIVLKWGENTLGVSLNEGRPSPTSKSPLQDLFRSTSDFKDFQSETLKRIKSRTNWVIAVLTTIVIIGGFYHDLLIDPTRYRVAKEWNYYSLSGPAGIVTTIIFPWLIAFLVGTIVVGPWMVLSFGRSISKIGKKKEALAISGLTTFEQRDEPLNNDQENEVREYTLKRFKQKSRII